MFDRISLEIILYHNDIYNDVRQKEMTTKNREEAVSFFFRFTSPLSIADSNPVEEID